MNRRDRVLELLSSERKQSYIPAAFFLHFDESCHRGQAAVDKHLEYFRYTGMDFVKIQYELTFPIMPEIRRPADWARVPRYGRDFFAAQLEVVGGIVERVKNEALVVVTLYSPFMCAGQLVRRGEKGGLEVLTEHLRESPDEVKPGLEAVTESLLLFVRECVKLGVDGFYTSTQGGEQGRFDDPGLFLEYIKPFDLLPMEEASRSCPFNILHICDYHGGYDDLSPYLDYPGQVVNSSLQLASRQISGREISRLFGRPYMGGMERHGVIVTGSEAEIRRAVREVIAGAPERFILAADCTVPSHTAWDNIRIAIDTAHRYGG